MRVFFCAAVLAAQLFSSWVAWVAWVVVYIFFLPLIPIYSPLISYITPDRIAVFRLLAV